MWFLYAGLLYTIKRSLAKLNIKHRVCYNKPIDYKMLTKFFLDIIAWLYGEGVQDAYQVFPRHHCMVVWERR